LRQKVEFEDKQYLTVYHIVPMTAPNHRLSIRHIISQQEHILLLFICHRADCTTRRAARQFSI